MQGPTQKLDPGTHDPNGGANAPGRTAEYGKVLFWVGVVTLFRIAYLFVFPYGLIADEAYYWDWGRHPDWGYYSKPPMIGWLMALAYQLGADSAPLVRIPATLFSSATMLVFYELGRSMYNSRVGWLSMVLFILTPASSVMALIFTIDAPLVFFWSLALLAFWKTFYREGGVRWGLVLVLALGLGNLSKQMMLFFPLLGLICLVLDPDRRGVFKRPMLYLGWLASLAFLAPPLWWNSQHDWITFKHTSHHFSTEETSFLEYLGQFFGFVASQPFIFSPLVYLGGVIALWQTLRVFRTRPDVRFLWLFSGPALIGFLFLALRQEVNPNWPAVFYISVLFLAVALFDGRYPMPIPKWPREFFRRSLWLGVVICIVVYALAFVTEYSPLKGTPADLFLRLRGFQDYAERVIEVRDRLPNPESVDLVVYGSRTYVSHLAFDGPGQPEVLTWLIDADGNRILNSQYAMWENVPAQPANDALIISVGRRDTPVPERLAQRYASVEKLEKLEVALGNRIKEFNLYHAKAKAGARDD